MEYMELISLISRKEEPKWDRVHHAINNGMERLKRYDPACYESIMDEIGAVAYHICDQKRSSETCVRMAKNGRWKQSLHL